MRLVASGFPCNVAAWQKFLEPLPGGTEILAFADYFEKTSKNSLKEFRDILIKRIEELKPDSLILHDFGVTIGLLALVKLEKTKGHLPKRVTIFNGAFHKFSLLKAPHPLLIQLRTWNAFHKRAIKEGMSVDDRLQQHFRRIKALYRQIALASLVGARLKGQLLQNRQFEMQVIGSEKDKYIPKNSVEALITAFVIPNVRWTNYPHFPYLGNTEEIVQWVLDFEVGK